MTLAGVDREATRLARALVDSGAASPGAELAAIDAAPIGIGAMADTFRVQLTWSVLAAGPASLVVKKPSTDAAAAATAASLGAYEREARFYIELAPRTAVRVPRLLGAVLDDGASCSRICARTTSRAISSRTCRLRCCSKLGASSCCCRRRSGRTPRPLGSTGCTAASACRSRT